MIICHPKKSGKKWNVHQFSQKNMDKTGQNLTAVFMQGTVVIGFHSSKPAPSGQASTTTCFGTALLARTPPSFHELFTIKVQSVSCTTLGKTFWLAANHKLHQKSSGTSNSEVLFINFYLDSEQGWHNWHHSHFSSPRILASLKLSWVTQVLEVQALV